MKSKLTKLKRKIRDSGLMLKEIAEKRGVSPGAVTHQAAVGVKTLRVAKEYAEVLGCDPVELLD